MASLPEWSDQSTPLQLIEFEQAGSKAHGGGPRLVVNENSRKRLVNEIGDRPAKVVAVCGLYRSGKSLLLNLLAGTQGSKSGFAVGDSIRACTAGVWARVSKPFGADGSVCLLLDCEGTGNTERDREHDARIFALAVLLSSYLVFNSKGVIDERAVQGLAVAASLAQHIHKQHKDISVGPTSGLRPSFLWVLRDFVLALEDNMGNEISEQEYLERTLRDPGTGAPGSDEGGRRADLREAREKIVELFPKRDCLCLVRPVEEEEHLQRLNELPLNKFRPKFLSQIENLRQRVFTQSSHLASPSGKVATVSAFLSLVDAHVEAMNTGGVPQLGSVWLQVSQQECGRALDEALRAFSAQSMEVTASLPANDEDLKAMLKRCEDSARKKFNELAMGDDKSIKENASELDSGIASGIARIEKENQQVAMRSIEAWLQREWDARVESAIKTFRVRHDGGNLPKESAKEAETLLKTRFSELRAAYSIEVVGPQASRDEAWQNLAEKKHQVVAREIASWQGRAETTAQMQASAEQAARDERDRLNADTAKASSQINKDVEESKARMAKMQQDQRCDQDGVQNWDAGDRAAADPSTVELREKSKQNTDGNKSKKADASEEARNQKKCCILQ